MVESIGGSLISSRLERKSPADPRTVRNLQKRIQRNFTTLREHMAVLHTWDCAAADEISASHPEPPTEEQITECGQGRYPWRPQGLAATALPHLASRYRDARAEVRLSFCSCNCVSIAERVLCGSHYLEEPLDSLSTILTLFASCLLIEASQCSAVIGVSCRGFYEH